MTRKNDGKVYLIRLRGGLPYVRRKLQDGTLVTPGEWVEVPKKTWAKLRDRDARKVARGGISEFEFKEVKKK